MTIKTALLALAISGAGALPVLAQATPASMMDECRAFAISVFQAPPERIDVKYEGRRTDGTHAVNGSVRHLTFQCSFRKDGYHIDMMYVNNPNPG